MESTSPKPLPILFRFVDIIPKYSFNPNDFTGSIPGIIHFDASALDISGLNSLASNKMSGSNSTNETSKTDTTGTTGTTGINVLIPNAKQAFEYICKNGFNFKKTYANKHAKKFVSLLTINCGEELIHNFMSAHTSNFFEELIFLKNLCRYLYEKMTMKHTRIFMARVIPEDYRQSEQFCDTVKKIYNMLYRAGINLIEINTAIASRNLGQIAEAAFKGVNVLGTNGKSACIAFKNILQISSNSDSFTQVNTKKFSNAIAKAHSEILLLF